MAEIINDSYNPVPRVVIPKDQVVEEKVYHCRIANSSFYDKAGKQHRFFGDELRTTSKNLQAELDEVVDTTGCPIYSRTPIISIADVAPADDIKARAAQIAEALQKQQQAIAAGGNIVA